MIEYTILLPNDEFIPRVVKNRIYKLINALKPNHTVYSNNKEIIKEFNLDDDNINLDSSKFIVYWSEDERYNYVSKKFPCKSFDLKEKPVKEIIERSFTGFLNCEEYYNLN